MPNLFLVSFERERSARLADIFRTQGWSVLHFPDSASLEQDRPLDLRGLAIVACSPAWDEDRIVAAAAGSQCVAVLCGACGARQASCAARWVEAGADFVSDASSDQLIAAKARAHARRLPIAVSPVITLPSLLIDRERRLVSRRRRGTWAPLARLSPTEINLLSRVAESPGQAVSCRDILEAVWGRRAGEVNAEIVYQYVSRIKRKLGPCGRLLKPVYGKGYMLWDPGAGGKDADE